MNSATQTVAGEFQVEGHGLGTLIRTGDCTSARSPRRMEPKLTRVEAWAEVKRISARGDCHTIKVIKSGEVVAKFFRMADGSYMKA